MVDVARTYLDTPAASGLSIAEMQQKTPTDWVRQRAWVEVDVAALAENVRQIKAFLSPQTELMAVVKADAYGHSAVIVAQTALQNGASWLGVATIPEGIELRQAGIKAPILILGATNTREQIEAIASWQLQPTLCTPEQARLFSETLQASHRTVPVHIKLDTGMSRLGAPWQEAAQFVQLVQRLPNLSIASIYSHLATADCPDSTGMRQQQQRFEEAIAQIKALGIKLPRLHLANSAATLTDPSLHYDMVRVGLAIYGLYPAPHLERRGDKETRGLEKEKENIFYSSYSPVNSQQSTVVGAGLDTNSNLQPITLNQNPPAPVNSHQSTVTSYPILKHVLQVKAKVTQVKNITAGTGVSYGHHFTADRDMRIAVVGIGYADGVPRSLSNKMKVLIRGQLVKQVGAITMDQLMLDVSNIPDVQAGEIVTLLGCQGDIEISADDWAATLGTISWEILCSFKHRLPRLSVND